MANKRELEEQIARLTAAVEEMRARMTGLEGATGRPSGLETQRSRRDLLRMGGAAALGAVGAAAMRIVPAAATDGSAVLAGQDNTSTLPTTISGTAAPAEIFGAKQSDFPGLPGASTFSGAIQGYGGVSGPGTAYADGVDGFASGGDPVTGSHTAFGVYGLTDSGTGVTGEAVTGVSLYARGTGRLRQDNLPLATNPTLQGFTANLMEQVRTSDGALWVSNPSGTWRRATTFEVFSNPRRVYGTGAFVNPNTAVPNIDATARIPSAGGGPSGVPAGATAAWAAVQSYEPAVIGFYPTGSPDPLGGAFGVMGTAGISVQVSFLMIPLNSSGHFSFTNRKTKARIFIDVWGYLTQALP